MKIGRLEFKIIWHEPLISPNNMLVAPRWIDIILGRKYVGNRRKKKIS